MNNPNACPSCYNLFNRTTRIPRILPCCKYSVCEACICASLEDDPTCYRCPKDNKSIMIGQHGLDTFPVNMQILSAAQDQRPRNICIQHNKPIELMCLTDNQMICTACVLFGTHKGHNYKNIEETGNEVEEKRTFYQNMCNTIRKYEVQAEEIIETKKRVFLSAIETRFTECINALHHRKSELIKDTENFFGLDGIVNMIRKDKAEQVFEQLSTCKMILEERLESINGVSNLPKEIREEDFSELFDERDIQTKIKLFGEWLDQYRIVFDETFEQQINDFCHFKKDDVKKPQGNWEQIGSIVNDDHEEEKDPAARFNNPPGRNNVNKINQEMEREEAIIKQNEVEYLTKKLTDELEKRSKQKENVNANFFVVSNQNNQNMGIFGKFADVPNDFKPYKTLIKIDLDQLRAVQRLELDFSSSEISRIMIRDLSYVAVNCPKIVSLVVNFAKVKISEADFEDFCYTFTKVSSSLQAIDINFEQTEIPEKSFKVFMTESLPRMTKLTHIKIDFARTQFTDEAFEDLVETTLPSLPELKSLEINFNQTSLTNRSLNRLSLIDEPSVENIRKLVLSFNRTKIQKQEIMQLKELNKKMKNLGILKIDSNTMQLSS